MPEEKPAPAAAAGDLPPVVLDTNIVLDLFVFPDTAAAPLRAHVLSRSVRWIATATMRNELARVLDYPHIRLRMDHYHVHPGDVLRHFDTLSHICTPAPRAIVTCQDPDDQPFIDLAAAQKAQLISKDKMVLRLRKRLSALGVSVARVWSPAVG